MCEQLSMVTGVESSKNPLVDQLLARIVELETGAERQTAQLEEANRELDALSYSISHDLRAPLRHIHGFTQILSESISSAGSEKDREYMEIVLGAAKRMEQMIDGLLILSRLGRVELERSRIDIRHLLEPLIAQLKTQHVGMDVTWAQGTVSYVDADQSLLLQVFTNLFLNSIKFARSGHPVEIEVGSASESAEEVVICVRDNGIGFDNKYADKIFGVFQSLHRKEEFEGVGIGLAVVRRIVLRHGGRAWAEGSEGGARFYVSFPGVQHVA